MFTAHLWTVWGPNDENLALTGDHYLGDDPRFEASWHTYYIGGPRRSPQLAVALCILALTCHAAFQILVPTEPGRPRIPNIPPSGDASKGADVLVPGQFS